MAEFGNNGIIYSPVFFAFRSAIKTVAHVTYHYSVYTSESPAILEKIVKNFLNNQKS